MSQASSVASPPPSSSTQPLNQVLQAALGCLDIQLEEELSRYRRQRAGRSMMPARSLGHPQSLIDLEPVESQSQAKADAAEDPSVLSSSQKTPTAQTPENPTHETDFSTTEATLPDPIGIDSEPSADNSVSENVGTSVASPQKPAVTVGGDLVYPAAAPATLDNYLTSSEHLLRSLAEEEAQIKKERRFVDNLLTPLGVGSMLLLLLSSATVGYMIMNPSTLGYLGLDRSRKDTTPVVVQSPTQAAPVTENTAAGTQISNGPNLASDEEFAELNLNNLSTLKTSPSPSVVLPQSALPGQAGTSIQPQGIPNRVGNGSPQDLASALLPSSMQPGTITPIQAPPPTTSAPSKNTIPAQVAASPKPTPATTKTPQVSVSVAQVVTTAEKDRKDLYYVLANYDSDRSLKQAKTVVPDAYLRKLSEGTRIQLGAFPQASQAQTLAQKLEKQGISAWIYHP